MIDRYLLRYFLAVVDRGSFSKAAKQANVAQPTLSVGIAKLERLLGTALFERSAQRVHLTPAGARFAAHARRIENEFNLAAAAVLDVPAASGLRLGVLSTIPTTHVAHIVRAVRHDNLRERLEIVPGSEREILQRLARGQIDAALTLVRAGAADFESEPLYAEGYALALPSSNPLAGEAAIAAEALAEYTMIVRRHCEVLAETSRHFIERGVRPYFALRSTNDDQVLALVQAGLGVTVMPASYSLAGVARPRLAGFDLKRQVGLLFAGHAMHLRHAVSPALGAIRDLYGAHGAPQTAASGAGSP